MKELPPIPSTEEEEQVIDGLEHTRVGGGLRDHLTQGRFEEKTIHEIEELHQNFKKQKYPLDGRNLELDNSSFIRKKKRKLIASSNEEILERAPRRRARSSSQIEAGSTSFQLENGSEYSCPTALWETLYDFQKSGVKFLVSKYEMHTGGLLADEMGLGKSIQIIGFIASIISSFGKLDKPALIICPSTLVSHWEDQFDKWGNGLVQTRHLGDHGVDSVSQSAPYVYIVSYEMFRSRYAKETKKIQFSVTVLDEAQRIRNPDAKITLAVKQIDCYCRVALSGSPIQNNLSELWSIFDFVAPGRLGTLPTFQEELAIPIEEGTKPRASFQQIQMSHRCAIVVRDLTAPFMLRRLKSDFSTDLQLSNKEEQVLFCQLSPEQIEIYVKFLSTNTVRHVVQSSTDVRRRQADRGKTFYALSILRRISNHPDLLLSNPLDVDDYGEISRSGKLGVLVPLLKLWHRQDKRCLVFSQSLGMLDILEIVLGKLGMSFARMDGSTPMNARTAIVEEFDSTNKKMKNPNIGPFCLLLSTRVGGVGLNLTAASRVVIFDPDWNPMTDAQARERSWRIGQREDVKIYRLIAADTVEEVICKRQIYKHHLANKILTDPRQGRIADWDGIYDLFKAPIKAGTTSALSGTSRKIFSLIDSNEIADEDELKSHAIKDEDASHDYQDLITKVWNQDEIEAPKLCSSLVDIEQVDQAAKRAVNIVLAEQQESLNRDITVPTWTGRSGGNVSSAATSQERSKSLLTKLRTGGAVASQPAVRVTTYESQQLVIERGIVKEIISFLKGKKSFSASTDEVLSKFASRVSSGESEIFRSCLRELCTFDQGDWTLKKVHRL